MYYLKSAVCCATDSLSGCPIAAMGKISTVQIKKALSSNTAGQRHLRDKSRRNFSNYEKTVIDMRILVIKRDVARRQTKKEKICKKNSRILNRLFGRCFDALVSYCSELIRYEMLF